MLTSRRLADANLFLSYGLKGFDEFFTSTCEPRAHYTQLYDRLAHTDLGDIKRRHRVADLLMRHQGITFTVYGRDQGVERIMPFDPIPPVVPADEWDRIERGLKQRVRALNLFVHDVYHNRLDSLRSIGGTRNEEDYATEAERLLGRLDGELRYVEPEELLSRGLHTSGLACRRPATG